jgi:hypothetical protein
MLTSAKAFSLAFSVYMLYNVDMEKHYAFIRALPQTLYNLKLLAAFEGETMIRTLDRIVKEACQRVSLSPHDAEVQGRPLPEPHKETTP